MLVKEFKKIIREFEGAPHHPGTGGTWTTWQTQHHTPIMGKTSRSVSVYSDEQPQVLDKDVEQQLIDYAIDFLLSNYPELIDQKKIRRHHVQMLIGRVTSGEVSDVITLKNFIKRLKKKTGIQVENKMKKSELKQLIKEVIRESIIVESKEEVNIAKKIISTNYKSLEKEILDLANKAGVDKGDIYFSDKIERPARKAAEKNATKTAREVFAKLKKTDDPQGLNDVFYYALQDVLDDVRRGKRTIPHYIEDDMNDQMLSAFVKLWRKLVLPKKLPTTKAN